MPLVLAACRSQHPQTLPARQDDRALASSRRRRSRVRPALRSDSGRCCEECLLARATHCLRVQATDRHGRRWSPCWSRLGRDRGGGSARLEGRACRRRLRCLSCLRVRQRHGSSIPRRTLEARGSGTFSPSCDPRRPPPRMRPPPRRSSPHLRRLISRGPFPIHPTPRLPARRSRRQRLSRHPSPFVPLHLLGPPPRRTGTLPRRHRRQRSLSRPDWTGPSRSDGTTPNRSRRSSRGTTAPVRREDPR